MSRFVKSAFVASTFLLPSLCVAAEVRSASVDEARSVIVLNVAYTGGCHPHVFELDIQVCHESPVRCEAKLVDRTPDDTCRVRTSKTVELTLSSQGLTDSYYSGASIHISGDNGTSATISLPH